MAKKFNVTGLCLPEYHYINLFLSEEEIQKNEIYNASVREKNQFITGGHLNMRLVLEKQN